MTNDVKKCPECGGGLTPGDPCPACMLGIGLESLSRETAAGTAATWTPPSIAELAGRFPELELLELIGRGGMGAVYKARQRALNRLVAVKILPPEIGQKPAFASRFVREAQALARLNHPNIVAIYEFGERDGLYFFIMEFVDGVNLRQLLETARVSPREALAIVPQICDALQCAHDQGIVHRDIKPENLLMDRQGRIKIADFGLAKLIQENGGELPVVPLAGGTETLAAVGTPSYMAPEQISQPGAVDHRADIYALGVVFYQMLTGELPGKELKPPSQRVQIDVRLDEIVLRALAKKPEFRYQQASVLKTQIETFAADQGKVPPVPTPAVPVATSEIAAVSDSRFSRTALAGAFWMPFFFIMAFLWCCVTIRVEGPYTGPAWWQIALQFTLLPLGLTAPFGTTILGWVAVSQIRRSAGKLYGMGLAVFDGLIFPLLVLDGVIFGLLWWAVRTMIQALGYGPAAEPKFAVVLFLTLLVAIPLDWLIVRHIWHAVNPSSMAKSQAPLAAMRPPVPAPRQNRWGWIVTIMTLHTIALVVATVFMVKVVPRMEAVFNHVIGPANLPEITQLIFGIGRWIGHGGYLLIPELLMADFGICWMLQKRANRKLLVAWGTMGLLALVGILAVIIFMLILPYQTLVGKMSHETHSAQHETNQTSAANIQTGPGELLPIDQATRQQTSIAGPEQSVAWPAGVDIKLLAVNDHPSRPGWWQADGSPAGEMKKPFISDGVGYVNPDEKFMARYFALDLTGVPATTSTLKLEGDSDVGPLGTLVDVDNGRWSTKGQGWEYAHTNPHRCGARVPRQARTVTLRVGVPFGTWETAAICTGDGKIAMTKATPAIPASFKIEQKANKALTATAKHRIEDCEFRLVAMTADGRIVESDTGGAPTTFRYQAPGAAADISSWWDFKNLPAAQVKEFRFQTRPYHWTVFRNVAVQPAAEPITSKPEAASAKALEQQRARKEQQDLEMQRAEEKRMEEKMLAERQAKRKLLAMPIIGGVTLLLLFLLIGGIAWITLGVKNGLALGRIALTLALFVPMCAILFSIIAGIFNLGTIGPCAYGLFLAGELPAFVMGVMSRKTSAGKAAWIVATALVVLSLLAVG